MIRIIVDIILIICFLSWLYEKVNSVEPPTAEEKARAQQITDKINAEYRREKVLRHEKFIRDFQNQVSYQSFITKIRLFISIHLIEIRKRKLPDSITRDLFIIEVCPRFVRMVSAQQHIERLDLAIACSFPADAGASNQEVLVASDFVKDDWSIFDVEHNSIFDAHFVGRNEQIAALVSAIERDIAKVDDYSLKMQSYQSNEYCFDYGFNDIAAIEIDFSTFYS